MGESDCSGIDCSLAALLHEMNVWKWDMRVCLNKYIVFPRTFHQSNRNLGTQMECIIASIKEVEGGHIFMYVHLFGSWLVFLVR